MVEAHSILLVILSVMVANIASYTAIDYYLRYRLSKKKYLNRRWFLSGSLVLGLGIWCMQFIGIFAYLPDNDLHSDLVYAAFTLMISIILSSISLYYLKWKIGRFFSIFIICLAICIINFISWASFYQSIHISINAPIFIMVFAIGCISNFLSLRSL